MKITTGLILNVLDHGWTIKETFYSRSPNMTFNAISCIFYSNWKNIRFPSWETQFPLPFNVAYHSQTVKLVVGAMAELIHT